MIIKIITKTKITYYYHEGMSYSINEDTKVISIGNSDYKIRANTSAFILNINGATVGVVKG